MEFQEQAQSNGLSKAKSNHKDVEWSVASDFVAGGVRPKRFLVGYYESLWGYWFVVVVVWTNW